MDLTGQVPARFASSTSLDTSRSYVIATSGRLRDTVRLVSPPPVSGPGGTPEGMPVRWSGMTSRFGMRLNPVLNQVRLHAGIDLRAAMGEPVHATSAGTVTAAGWQGGYGLAVRIDNGKGIETRYAHLSRLAVSTGQTVKSGDLIGLVGSTGRSTGPHLHYEVRKNGRPVDPASTLRK
jgi:murein DD-endopeptidase MepM/ murein hydrolase activator NlpD